MRPKLNSNNYTYETLALIIHEVSHLIGASEKDADLLQSEAIYDLKNRNFHIMFVNMNGASQDSALKYILSKINYYRAYPNEITLRIMRDLKLEIFDIRSIFENRLTGNFLLARRSYIDNFIESWRNKFKDMPGYLIDCSLDKTIDCYRQTDVVRALEELELLIHDAQIKLGLLRYDEFEVITDITN